MKKQIVASGGGGFGRRGANLKLEKYLLSLTGKENPSICFLPQASAEDADYVVRFFETFTQLNARPTWVSLFGRVEPTWQEKILNADIVYVGGGNTRSMLALWREWGVDELLKKAYEQGTIMSGVSAGALCWFEQAVTDSVWPLGVIPGLGFLTGSCCPHFDSEKERRPAYERMLREGHVMSGIALEDDTAAHFIDGTLHAIIGSAEGKKAFACDHGQTNALKVEYV
jgi:peptidase E